MKKQINDLVAIWNNNPLIAQFKQWQTLSPHNTRAEFARLCGVDRSRMSQYLNNKAVVSARDMVKICKALKCKTIDVIGKEKNNG